MHYVSFTLTGEIPPRRGFPEGRTLSPEGGKRILRRLPPLRSSFWPAGIAGILVLTALVVLGSSTSGEVAVTMPFLASQDTFVDSAEPSTSLGKRTSWRSIPRRATSVPCVRFPIAGIPSSATIQSATLKLYVA